MSLSRVLGIGALVLLFVALIVVVAGLSLSVVVDGQSMEPTLHSGDRLEVDLLHRHDVHRFDLVEAVEPPSGAQAGGADIVKRVIGLPGDRIAIRGGTHPVVLLRPAGSPTTYEVENDTWSTQIAGDTASCCQTNGTLVAQGGMRWTTVPAQHYWLIGDNWGGSTDSRVFGFVSASDLKATLNWRILPWGRTGRVPDPARLVAPH